jgi:hypothetical protein
MKTIQFFLICVLILFLCSVSDNKAIQAQTTDYQTYLPLVYQVSPDYGGSWQGIAAQRGRIFNYDLNIAVNGSAVTGTGRVSSDDKYAVMSITGSVFGSQLLLDEQEIIDTNGPAKNASRWCVKTVLLTSKDQLLSGTWNQTNCNQGRAYFQRLGAPVPQIAGTWVGTAIQSTKSFNYSIILQQNGNLIEGLAHINNEAYSGTLRLNGMIVGSYVVLQETEILESNASSWCMKTLELNLESTPQKTLHGEWNAIGFSCSGEVSLTAQQ